MVRAFDGARGVRVRVNGTRVEMRRLESGDILFLAGRRYRIEYSKSDQIPPAPVPAGCRAGAIAGAGSSQITFDVPRGLLIPQGEGCRFPLVKPTIVVGSARDSDLVLPGRTVAPHHCRLDFDQGWWRVTDTSRGLGMRIDHVPVQQRWLYPGDVLAISTFRYEVHYPVGVSLSP
ncbi:MAG: FHA domain-containing protein [Maioricimonas sp. JB049]